MSTEAIAVAQRMLKAAGKCKPETLGRAAMVVLELAFMTGRPDAYVDWKIEQAKKKKPSASSAAAAAGKEKA